MPISSKNHVNYIKLYTKKINKKEIIAGDKVITFYNLLEKWLKEKKVFYNDKKAKKALVYIENFCRHHEGEKAPNLIELELWQRAAVSVIFGIVDKDGYRQFTEVFIVAGRKIGKTLLCAAIASYCSFADGKYGNRIYFAAPKLKQAKLCFTAYWNMLRKEPELYKLVHKRRDDVYIDINNTTAEPLAFNADKSDGFNISLAICDEIASWKGVNGKRFYEVIKSSYGARREGLLISITTAGYEDDGIYDELMLRSSKVLNGISDEMRLMPLIYMIDDESKWDDINEIKKAIPNLGVSAPESYIKDELKIAKNSFSKRAEFKTKYCCLKQNSVNAWLDVRTIKKCIQHKINLNDLKSKYCVVGIDLSQTMDITAVVYVIEKDGILNIVPMFWLPENRLQEAIERDNLPYDKYIERGELRLCKGDFIKYEDIYNYIVEMFKVYEIIPLQIGYDRYSALYLIDKLKRSNFHMDDVYQGDNLYGVIQEAEGLMMESRINIGNNQLFKMHMLNSAIKFNGDRQRGRLVKVNQTLHIDGVAALLDAMCVRQKYNDQIGQRLKNVAR